LAGARERLLKFLEDQKDENDSLIFNFFSWGGGFAHGKTLFNELRALATGRKLYIVTSSEISSMALFVLMAVPREQRFTFPMTYFYFHKSRMQHEVGSGWNLKDQHEYDMKEYGAEIELGANLDHDYEEVILKGSTMTKAQIRELETNPRYLSAKEAVQLGLVAGIIER